MFKKLGVLVTFVMLTFTSAYCAGGEQPSKGSDDKPSKYDKGHKLVISGKYLEKKADKSLKKGNTKKAEKSIAKAKERYEKAFKILLEANREKPNNPDTLNYLGFTSRKL